MSYGLLVLEESTDLMRVWCELNLEVGGRGLDLYVIIHC